MLHIAPSIVLDADAVSSLAYPAVLWQSLVTAAGITADEEDADYPATNLANPQTSSLWKGETTGDQDIVFDVDPTDAIDAVGIARHNLGSTHCGMQIYGKTADVGASFELLADLSPGDDADILAIVGAGYYVQIKISLAPDATIPQMAVVYVGTLLRMSKGLIPGFAPPADALQTSLLSGIAENGDFLDDVIVSQRRSSSFTLRPQAGSWYRDNVRPWLEARSPFFFAWSPLSHSGEASFAKFDGDPQVTLGGYRDYFDVSFKLTALAF